MKKNKKNMPPKKKHNVTKIVEWIMLILMVASSAVPLIIYAIEGR